VAAVALAAMPHALVGVFYDDGIYLALAKSLAEGHGYHLLYLPGAPPAVHYPFGYPAFLAALWRLWPAFPANVTVFRAANAVLLGGAAGLGTAWIAPRLKVPAPVTAAVIAAACTAVPLLAVVTVLFAEPLFLVLTAAACWAGDAARSATGRADAMVLLEGGRHGGAVPPGEERAPRPGRALALAILAGVLAGTAALTRSIGIAVIGGLVLSFAVRKQWRLAVAVAVPAALIVAPWQAWVLTHHAAVDPLMASNYGTYGDFLTQSGMGWLSAASLMDLGGPLAAITTPPGPVVLRLAFAVLALAVLVVGLVTLTRKAPALGWSLWCYLFIVALWPYGPDRFLWGVLPWLAVAFLAGVRKLTAAGRSPAERQVLKTGALVAAAAVAVGFAVFQARVGLKGATETQVGISDTMNDILPWIRSSTDTSAVIAGEDEALLWLYTGRHAVPSYLWRVHGREAVSFGADSLRAFFERNGVTHVILTGPGSEAAPTLDDMLGRYPGYLAVSRVWPGQLMAFTIRRGG